MFSFGTYVFLSVLNEIVGSGFGMVTRGFAEKSYVGSGFGGGMYVDSRFKVCSGFIWHAGSFLLNSSSLLCKESLFGAITACSLSSVQKSFF